MENVKFDFNDILITPKIHTKIKSRYSDIDPYYNYFNELHIQNHLPLLTAPMDSVIDINNLYEYTSNNIAITLPRTFKHSDYINYKYINYKYKNNTLPEFSFVSFGLDDFINCFIKYNLLAPKYVLIDVANGHMNLVMDTAKEFKEKYPNTILMIGNVANPETYRSFAQQGCVDLIRIGIGNGGACVISGTKIITTDGIKNIEDVTVGDFVLTHKNTYEEVINKFIKKETDDLIKINNKITTTKDHKFYVLHKKHQTIINDNNIHEYAEWIEAQNLNSDYLLLELINDV